MDYYLLVLVWFAIYYALPFLVLRNSMTIEELVEKCNKKNGMRLRWLKNEKTHWLAQARPEHTMPMPPDLKAKGKTIREALENLIIEMEK